MTPRITHPASVAPLFGPSCRIRHRFIISPVAGGYQVMDLIFAQSVGAICRTAAEARQILTDWRRKGEAHHG